MKNITNIKRRRIETWHKLTIKRMAQMGWHVFHFLVHRTQMGGYKNSLYYEVMQYASCYSKYSYAPIKQDMREAKLKTHTTSFTPVHFLTPWLTIFICNKMQQNVILHYLIILYAKLLFQQEFDPFGVQVCLKIPPPPFPVIYLNGFFY